MGDSSSEDENARLVSRRRTEPETDISQSHGQEVTVEAIELFSRRGKRGLKLLEGPLVALHHLAPHYSKTLVMSSNRITNTFESPVILVKNHPLTHDVEMRLIGLEFCCSEQL